MDITEFLEARINEEEAELRHADVEDPAEELQTAENRQRLTIDLLAHAGRSEVVEDKPDA